MKDWIVTGAVYLPFYFIGHAVADRFPDYAFMIGWLVGVFAFVTKLMFMGQKISPPQ